ncbi:MAG: hypothetical protein IJ407_04615 [Clostridia bacterium]|nr:hypothetical protein [Clostridia bacterium]
MKKAFLFIFVAVLLLFTGCSALKSEEDPLIATPSEEVNETIIPSPAPSDEAVDTPTPTPSNETVDIPAQKEPDLPEEAITTKPVAEVPTTDPSQNTVTFPYHTDLSEYWGGNADLLPSIFRCDECPEAALSDSHKCVPLPLIRLDTADALALLQDRLEDHSLDGSLPPFQKVTSHCDDTFFESNSLIVVHIRSLSCSYRYEARSVEQRGESLSFTLAPEDITEDTLLDWGEGNFLLTIIVPKADLKGCTQIYAHADTLTPNLI